MPVLNGIRAVIIDLDGTMLDTAGDFHVAVNRMRADLELGPLALAKIRDFVGKGTENLMRRVLACDFSEDGVEQHFEQAITAYERHYLAINGDYTSAYPDMRAGLEAMQAKGLRLACVTNKPIAFTIPLLRKKELLHFFEVIYGGDSLPKKKPDPYPLLQVCTDFAMRPAQVAAIGDSSNDAIAARAAGCPILLVPYGYNHGESIQDVNSDGIVQTLLEAAHLLHV
jgi:phosphoglycolate phosphatase